MIDFNPPGVPSVPVSKIAKSPFNLVWSDGMNSLLPCMPFKLCSQGLIPAEYAICFKRVVVVVFPLVPPMHITGFSGVNSLKMSPSSMILMP